MESLKGSPTMKNCYNDGVKPKEQKIKTVKVPTIDTPSFKLRHLSGLTGGALALWIFNLWPLDDIPPLVFILSLTSVCLYSLLILDLSAVSKLQSKIQVRSDICSYRIMLRAIDAEKLIANLVVSDWKDAKKSLSDLCQRHDQLKQEIENLSVEPSNVATKISDWANRHKVIWTTITGGIIALLIYMPAYLSEMIKSVPHTGWVIVISTVIFFSISSYIRAYLSNQIYVAGRRNTLILTHASRELLQAQITLIKIASGTADEKQAWLSKAENDFSDRRDAVEDNIKILKYVLDGYPEE